MVTRMDYSTSINVIVAGILLGGLAILYLIIITLSKTALGRRRSRGDEPSNS